jgi:hypothetical protein
MLEPLSTEMKEEKLAARHVPVAHFHAFECRKCFE